jgi:hypothetical protein
MCQPFFLKPLKVFLLDKTIKNKNMDIISIGVLTHNDAKFISAKT